MKRLLALLMALIFVSLLGGCGKAPSEDALAVETSSAQDTESETSEQTTDKSAGDMDHQIMLSFTEKTDAKRYTTDDDHVFLETQVKYPVIKSQPQLDYVEKISAEIEKKAMATLEPDDENYNEYKAAYEEMIKYTTNLQSYSTSEYTCTIAYDNVGILSYYEDFSGYYCGAAHGGTNREGHTYDLKTQRELSYQELLGADFETVRTQACKLFEETDEEITFGLSAVYDEFENVGWYLSEEGVVFFFQQYQVACYAAGMPSITMPLDTFK